MSKGSDTRERIVDTAVRLFNESGSGIVTTNHIARAMGISPGNLYYYFRNKEEIIRAILERMIARMDDVWRVPAEHTLSLRELRQSFEQVFGLLRDFRFFQHELTSLLQRDPELKRRYKAVRAQRLVEMRAFFTGMAEAGVLSVPVDTAVMENLMKIGWLVSDYWLSYLDVEERTADPAALAEGVDLMIEGMRPYMRPEDFAALANTSPMETDEETG